MADENERVAGDAAREARELFLHYTEEEDPEAGEDGRGPRAEATDVMCAEWDFEEGPGRTREDMAAALSENGFPGDAARIRALSPQGFVAFMHMMQDAW